MSGCCWSQPSTSHHTPSNGSGRVRQVRGPLAFRVCRSNLTLSPQLWQMRQETLQACPIGCAPRIQRADRRQRRLGLAYAVQQRHGVQVSTGVAQRPLPLLAHVVTIEQPVAGCHWLAVTLGHAASIPALCQQLEGRLEVVHVQTHSTVEVGHRLAGDRSRVALVSNEAPDHRAVLLLYPRLVVLAIRPRPGELDLILLTTLPVSLMNTLCCRRCRDQDREDIGDGGQPLDDQRLLTSLRNRLRPS